MLLLLAVPGCKQEAPPPSTIPMPGPISSDGTTRPTDLYTNSEYGFSFSFFSDEFELIENYRDFDVALLGPFLWDYEHRINILIIIDKFPKNKSLDDFIEDNIEAGEKTFEDYATVDEYSVTVAGLPARAVVFTFKHKVGEEIAEYEDIFIAFIKDSMVYMIKYDVPTEFYEEFKDYFDMVVSSFQFN